MLCTVKKTLEISIECHNDVIVCVKENQKTLLEDCVWASDCIQPLDIYEEESIKKCNRIEKRKVKIYNDMLGLTNANYWKLIKCIIKVERHTEKFITKSKKRKITDETSFYISTTDKLTALNFFPKYCFIIKYFLFLNL